MRAIGFVAAVMVIAGFGCGESHSGDGGSDDRGGGPHVGGKTGTGGAGAMPAGNAGNFGNAGGNQGQITPGGMNAGTGGTGAGTGGASGMCQVGKFCAPTSPDPGDCGTITLESSVKTITTPGTVLLIWDRSTSMTEDWNGMQRWQGAGTGMLNALTPLQDLLTIGAIFFPAQKPGTNDDSVCLIPGCTCSVEPYSSPEQLPFQPGAMALQTIQAAAPSGVNPMYGPVGTGATTDPNAVAAIGQTPTSEGIAAADVMLQNSTFAGIATVVLVTDGEPNCAWDQNATTTTVAKWLSLLNVKTYVVGLPGAAGGGMMGGTGNGAAVLNAIAQAGGTMQYIDAADTTTLQTQLSAIVMSTVQGGFDSCSIDLDPAADPADKLQLVLTESIMGMPTDEAAPHDLGNGGGWTITDDGKHVELVGTLCSDAMGGRFQALKFTYGCKELPPVPPEPPPE